MEFLRQWLKDWLSKDVPAHNYIYPGVYFSVYGDGRAYVGKRPEHIEVFYQGQQLFLPFDHARLLLEDLADALGVGSFMVPAPPLNKAKWRADEIVAIADSLGVDNRYLAVSTAMKIYEMGDRDE